MKGKALIPLVVGLVVGVFAIKLTMDFVRNARGSTSGDEVAVVRARVQIGMANAITPEMVQVVKVPRAFVPKDGFAKIEDVVGRVTAITIAQDSPISAAMLAPKGALPGIEGMIPKGYRAVAVQIDESSGVGYHVKPGNRVDVVAVMDMPKAGGRSEKISKTVLQNVEVGAVGAELGGNPDKGAAPTKSVTLFVKPEFVTRLHLAAQTGKIRLALRNKEEKDSTEVADVSEDELFGSPAGVGAKSRPGLLGRLLGGSRERATAEQPDPRVLAAMVNQARAPEQWTVETYAVSLKDKTKRDARDQAQFNSLDSVRRSSAGDSGATERSFFALRPPTASGMRPGASGTMTPRIVLPTQPSADMNEGDYESTLEN